MGRSLVLILSLLHIALGTTTVSAVSTSRAGGAQSPTEELSAERRADMERELALIRDSLRQEDLEWIAGETSFLRLSREERDARLLSRPWPAPMAGDPAFYTPLGYNTRVTALDWRDEDGRFVTPIREQGDCAAGWVFAATACLESAFLISIGGGELPDFDLSEQRILSCLGDQGLPGSCEAGWADDVLWFAQNVGVREEACLSYRGEAAQPCLETCEDPLARGFRITDYGFVCHALDLPAIKDALHNYGPLATTMTIHQGFEAYAGGIYRASGPITGYHAVLLIGYDDEEECFIGKNSWGPGWGEEGFFRIAYENACEFGNWSTFARFDSGDLGPFAAMSMDLTQWRTGDPVRFTDRSISRGAPLLGWDWDFDGDGEIDASGPGPHEHVFRDAGPVSPRLSVMDEQGREDMVSLAGRFDVIWDGPVWLVDGEDGSVYGDGSPQHPFLNIQTALNAAAGGDTVRILPGVYTGPMNSSLSPGAKNLVIQGEGALGSVTLDGEDANRLMVLDLPEGLGLTVENISFVGGHDSARGGALLITSGSPRFVSCHFANNSVGPDAKARGAAVWSEGSPIFEDCYFSDNHCAGDGGALHGEDGRLQLRACGFEANQAAGVGGALCLSGGELDVDHCYFADNESGGSGGAVHLLHCTANIAGSYFQNNRVDGEDPLSGGGALAAGKDCVLDLGSSILAGNSASWGGAIYLADSRARLDHLTCWRNRAKESGGALATEPSAEIEVSNSIFWENEAEENPEILAALGSFRHCLVRGGHSGQFIIDADPLLVDPEDGDFHLAEDSPCLSAGLAEEIPGEDYEGLARTQPAGSSPDLGACESPLAGAASAIEETAAASLRFDGLFPNPFNPNTTFAFELPAPAEVRLLVILPSGRQVAIVVDAHLTAGSHRVPWTAQDEEGQALASGMYLVRLECRYEDGLEELEIRKAILVK